MAKLSNQKVKPKGKPTKKPLKKHVVTASRAKSVKKTTALKPVSAKPKTKKLAKPKFEPFCVFCGAPPEAATRLIVSEYNFAICPECVEMCNTVLLSEDFDNEMKAKDKINWRKTLTELLAQPSEFFVFPEGEKSNNKKVLPKRLKLEY